LAVAGSSRYSQMRIAASCWICEVICRIKEITKNWTQTTPVFERGLELIIQTTNRQKYLLYLHTTHGVRILSALI